jgi:transposase
VQHRRPLHPDAKTDDHDLEAIFLVTIIGYGLAVLPVGEVYPSLQALSRHRHNLVKQCSRVMVQIRRLLHQTMTGFAEDKFFPEGIDRATLD